MAHLSLSLIHFFSSKLNFCLISQERKADRSSSKKNVGFNNMFSQSLDWIVFKIITSHFKAFFFFKKKYKGSANALQLIIQCNYAHETTLPNLKCSGTDQFSVFNSDNNSQATVRQAVAMSNWNYRENFRTMQWAKLALAQECELLVQNNCLYSIGFIAYILPMDIILFGNAKTRLSLFFDSAPSHCCRQSSPLSSGEYQKSEG